MRDDHACVSIKGLVYSTLVTRRTASVPTKQPAFSLSNPSDSCSFSIFVENCLRRGTATSKLEDRHVANQMYAWYYYCSERILFSLDWVNSWQHINAKGDGRSSSTVCKSEQGTSRFIFPTRLSVPDLPYYQSFSACCPQTLPTKAENISNRVKKG